MTAPLITVLITTYNYGRFIEEAIDSVLAQDFPQNKVQILVVDDGSTDDTAERIRKYGPRLEYLYKPNSGQASALNIGFEKAMGEIIALLDADDFFLPGKLARVAEAFHKAPDLGMVYHCLLEWDTRTNQCRALTPHLFSGHLRNAPHNVLSYFVQPASCVSFRRRLLAPLLPIPETIRMLADAYLVILVPLISPILALSQSLTLYRVHGSNSYYLHEQSTSSQMRNARFVRVLIDAMRGWLTANGYSSKERHVRFFLNRWRLADEAAQFRIDPPSRLRFFGFLIRHNHAFRPIQTWRFTIFNYLSAPSAIIFGYGSAQAKWNTSTMKALQRAYRALFRPRSKEET